MLYKCIAWPYGDKLWIVEICIPFPSPFISYQVCSDHGIEEYSGVDVDRTHKPNKTILKPMISVLGIDGGESTSEFGHLLQ